MKFSLIGALGLATLASAVAIPSVDVVRAVEQPLHVSFSGYHNNTTGELIAGVDVDTRDVQKREIIVTLLVAFGTAAFGQLGILAANEAVEQIKNVANWNSAREAFTQATTLAMWNSNPDKTKYPAVICYNKGYSVKNAAGIAGKTSVKLSSGALHTNYDCMYMTANNAFYTWSDGGYVNLSYRYSSKCSYNSANGDLSC